MIVIDANWDDEAGVWYAVARGEIGLATEAQTLDVLRERIIAVLPDLLDLGPDADAPFDLVVHTGGSAVAAA